jgi:hypothetical protein
MKRITVSLLRALPISVAVTILLFFASAFYGGVCHCETLISILFPYGTFISMRTSWDSIGLAAILLQFPFYAIVIAIVNGRRSRLLVSLLILIVHSIAAVGALTMYRWW